MTAGPFRGRVVWAVTDPKIGRKPYVVVSNNRRNAALNSVLAARIATTQKPSLPTVVELDHTDPLVGRVLCDEVAMLWGHEIDGDAGALSPRTLKAVDDGLRHALAL